MSRPVVRKWTRTLLLRLMMTWFLLGFAGAGNGVAADIYTFRDNGEQFFTNAPCPGSRKLRFPLAVKRAVGAPVRSAGAPSAGIDAVIGEAGRLYDVDPDLVRAVIKAESNFNHRAVSPKGASGLMQLMPGTARELGVKDPFDPEENIMGGVQYLSRLLSALDGNLPLSLAAYNAGLERVREKGGIPSFPETRFYIRRVLDYYETMKGR